MYSPAPRPAAAPARGRRPASIGRSLMVRLPFGSCHHRQVRRPGTRAPPGSRAGEEGSRRRRSRERPRWRKATSSARRRAWPRSWVVITMVMPSAAKSAIIASIARGWPPGSSWAQRLVEEQHLGPQRPGPRHGEPLLLAARQQPRRRPARASSPKRASAASRPRRARRARHAARARGRGRGCRGPSGAAAPAAGTPSPAPARRARASPRRSARRSARISPWQSRSSRLLPAPFGPRITSRRPAVTVRSMPVEQRARRRRR